MSVIRLGEKTKKKWDGIGEQLRRLEKMPLPIRILASPKTTAVLGTALAALTGGAALVPAKLWLGTKITGGVALGEGLIQASPKVEEFAKRKLQPEKVGKYIGGQIESFGKESDASDKLTFKERVKEGLKKAGLVGGAIALAGATALGVSKALPYVKTKLAERKARKVGIIEKDVIPPQVALEHPYISPTGLPSTSPIEARQPTLKQPPIQNIIQIQVQ